MRLLDLFCGAGGAAMGYHRAGFDVTGVDIEPMKHKGYPFIFYQADALEFVKAHGKEFDVIHASPPCQHYSEMQRIFKNHDEHPDLVDATREALIATGKPFVIENVPGAPLRVDLQLCGTHLGLRIIRHRIFESSEPLTAPDVACDHSDVYDPWHGTSHKGQEFRSAMGIDWMPDVGGGRRKGTVSQAIPPAYTEWIGRQLIVHAN